MKKSHFQTVLYAACGIMLSLLTVLCVCVGVNREPVAGVKQEILTEAVSRAVEGIRTGDCEQLHQLLYGEPKLKAPAEGRIWNAFRESISCSFPEAASAQGTGLLLKVELQCMDIDAVLEEIEQTAPQLLRQKMEDASHASREALVEQALEEATELALAAPACVSTELTVELARTENGQWLPVPTQELLGLLYGDFPR